MNLFGFTLERSRKKDERDAVKRDASIGIPIDTDGASTINSAAASAGYYGHVLNMEGASFVNERDLIIKYRQAASQPECDNAIGEIVDAAIVSDSDGAPVNIILDKLEISDSIKERIRGEFSNILEALSFNSDGLDIFRRWYIDGKLFYHVIVDPKKEKKGIIDLRLLDPACVKKVKEITTSIDKSTGAKTTRVTSEYYLYNEAGMSGSASNSNAIKISPDSIVYVPSGIVDETGTMSISHLHKSVKLVNQLRMMEDSLVIYRISRAPERRIFYIDVGNLPKGKAEEYVQGIMSKYRNKLIYDANTGEIRDDRRSMSAFEDFWLPRREGGKGTEISTLPGGSNLSEIEDVIFFQKKLYRSLNVPLNRLESESMFSAGRVSEISREEVRFQKFVNKLRKKFSRLFIATLRVQLILKGIVTPDDWESIKENINIDFVEDNFFSELKEFEIIGERMNLLDRIQPHIGKYYSDKWVRSNVLNMSDDDIERMDKEIKDEGSDKDFEDDDIGRADFVGM